MEFTRNEIHTTTLSATLDAPAIQAILEAAVRDRAGVAEGQAGVMVSVALQNSNDTLTAAVRVEVDHTQIQTPPPA